VLPETEGLSFNSWFDLHPPKAPLLSTLNSAGLCTRTEMQKEGPS